MQGLRQGVLLGDRWEEERTPRPSRESLDVCKWEEKAAGCRCWALQAPVL